MPNPKRENVSIDLPDGNYRRLVFQSFFKKILFRFDTRRNLNNLIRSVEASWDSLGSKLSVDGTPLDDEDAGILCTTILLFIKID